MSLKIFHIIFISASSILSLGFSIWSLQEYRTTGDTTDLVYAILGVIALLGLMIYGKWFWKKLKKMPMIAGLTLALGTTGKASTSWACAVCFGDPSSLLTQGGQFRNPTPLCRHCFFVTDYWWHRLEVESPSG